VVFNDHTGSVVDLWHLVDETAGHFYVLT
jgi:hypothetical protein